MVIKSHSDLLLIPGYRQMYNNWRDSILDTRKYGVYLKEEYNLQFIDYDGIKFESEQAYTMFLLKWS